MNKKEFLVQRKKIIKFYKKWKRLLKLDNWSIKLDFRNEVADQGSEYKRGELKIINNKFEAVMLTTPDPYYLEAVITIFVPVLSDYTDEENEESVIHELMHIMISPLSPNKKTLTEESVVTLLARSFMVTEKFFTNKK